MPPSDEYLSRALSWKNTGNDYFKKGMYEEAKNCYQKAIEINPDYQDAWNNLSLTYFKMGNITESNKCKTHLDEIEKVVTCSYCGAYIEQGSKLCGYCGNELKIVSDTSDKIVSSQDEVPDWLDIGNFGNNTEWKKYTPTPRPVSQKEPLNLPIGHTVNKTSRPQFRKQSPKKASYKKGAIFASIIILLVIVGVILIPPIVIQSKTNPQIDTTALKNKVATSSPTQDPIIGVWKSNVNNFDISYRYNADGTFVQETYDPGAKGHFILYGTWTAQGGNLYTQIWRDSGNQFTIIYDPARNVIYRSEYANQLYSPYTGDVVVITAIQTTPGYSNPPSSELKSVSSGDILKQKDSDFYIEIVDTSTDASGEVFTFREVMKGANGQWITTNQYTDTYNPALDTSQSIKSNFIKVDNIAKSPGKTSPLISPPAMSPTPNPNGELTQDSIRGLLVSMDTSNSMSPVDFKHPDDVYISNIQISNDPNSGLKSVKIVYFLPYVWDVNNFMGQSVSLDSAIFENLLKDPKIGKITATSTLKLTDKYGKENIQEGLSVTMSKSTANRINWENLLAIGDYSRLLNVADGYIMNPSVRAGL